MCTPKPGGEWVATDIFFFINMMELKKKKKKKSDGPTDISTMLRVMRCHVLLNTLIIHNVTRCIIFMIGFCFVFLNIAITLSVIKSPLRITISSLLSVWLGEITDGLSMGEK